MSVSAEKSFVRCSEEQGKYNLRTFSAMRTVVGHFNQKMKSKEEGVCFIQTKACMKRSYPAVFTALSVGAYSVSLEGACSGVAAWIHTFLM